MMFHNTNSPSPIIIIQNIAFTAGGSKLIVLLPYHATRGNVIRMAILKSSPAIMNPMMKNIMIITAISVGFPSILVIAVSRLLIISIIGILL